MHPLSDIFQQHTRSRNWLVNGESVLLALSGGPDSMVMAQLFLELGCPLIAGHCNYRLRGAEADADEQLVADWCRQNAVPFYNTAFDTETIAADWKKSIQETARILRYEWLDQVRIARGCKWIATAHHADDNVETMLMHLFKGTGIAGMHGIPEQNGSIIRPLLFATKEQLLAFAADTGIVYREDASNEKNIYARNAIRNRVIPVIEEFFPGAVRQMQETIGRLGQAEILYREAFEARRKKLMEQRGKDWYIPVLKLRQARPLETIAYELFAPYGFSPAQTEQVLHLLDAESGRAVASATHRVIRHRDFLVLTATAPEETDILLVEALPAVLHTPEGAFHFREEDKPARLPDDKWTACLDISELRFPLVLRRPRTGDYFYPLGMARKKKKLSRFLIDQKLGQHEKEKIWVLESGGRIAWIAGLRPDERFRVRDATQKILKVTVRQ